MLLVHLQSIWPLRSALLAHFVQQLPIVYSRHWCQNGLLTAGECHELVPEPQALHSHLGIVQTWERMALRCACVTIMEVMLNSSWPLFAGIAREN